MKKITFLIFTFLSSLAGFAQLAPEGFEGTWTANQGPAGWTIRNIAGPVQTWQQANNSDLTPSHTGTKAAYMNRETVAPGTTTEDWLVTPSFEVPTNGQLKFWSRLTFDLDQGTLYKVMIGQGATAATATYTELINWTELTLNTNQLQYEEKVVNIPAAHVGQQRYIAFVMMGNNGDRWLIDDVSVVTQCFAPTTLPTTNITGTSASINWTDVAGSGAWEVEVVPAGTAPTGAGTEYTGSLPYAVSGLAPSTTYNYYVRSLCEPDGNNSTWAGPFSFSTTQVPADLPWSTDFETANVGFTLVNGTQTNKWTVGTATANSPFTSMYISNTNGTTNAYSTSNSSTVHAYRDVNIAAGTGMINFSFDWKNLGEAGWDYIRVWNVPSSYVPAAGTQITASTTPGAERILVTGPLQSTNAWTTFNTNITVNTWVNTTRRFVFEWINDSSGGTNPPGAIDNVAFTIVTCPPPANLTASALGMTTATLSWTEIGSATSWEVYAVPVGDPAPTASTTGQIVTGTPTTTIENLTAATQYKYYVRSICSGTDVSTWSGPFNFNTTVCEVANQCTYTFNLTDSWGDGWNGNTMTVAQNGITMGTLTMASGSTATVSVVMCDNLPFTLFWNAGGSFATEVGVSIVNNHGQVLFTRAPGTSGQNSLLYTGAVNCSTPECLPPSGLTATNLTQTSASLGWAGPATGNWEYYVVPVGTAAPTASTTGVVTTTQPVTVSNLTPSTTYSYYVRILCTGGTTSTWAGPYTFTTTQIPADLNYSDNFEGAFNWTLLNGTQTNQWFYGTAVSNSPTHSLYVTNNAGVSNAYTTSAASVVHAYRDIAVPTGTTDINVSFDWRNQGETGWDFIRVYAVPTDFSPTVGTMIGTLPANGAQLGANFVGNSNWTTYNQIFDASAFAGGNMRLIFQWRNDTSGGTNPPGAIDNVNLSIITCPQPQSVLVNNISDTDAVVAWTQPGTATQWEIIALPSTSPAPTASTTGTLVFDNPHTLTDLTPGTVYTVYVRAVCSDDDKSLWTPSSSFTTAVCAPEDQCNYSFILTDSFGDGWNGNTMSVRQNGVVVGTLNLASGSGPVTVTVPLCNGVPFELFWNSGGSFPTEVGVAVQNSFAQVLYTKAPGTGSQNTLLYTGDVDCDSPACLPPTGLTATEITTTSALLGWGGPTTGNWEVYVTGAGNPAPTETQTGVISTTTNPVLVDNLEASTQYDFYVRVICEDGSSLWAGPYNFETLPLCPNPTNIEIHCLDDSSATFTWTAGGSETSWEVAVVPAANPVPTTGTVVTNPTYYVDNLTVSTAYVFYVRAVCADIDGYSSWATVNFTTPVVSAGQAQALCAGILATPQQSNWGNTIPPYGQVGCLFSTPNPTWYYVTLGGDGEVVLNLNQVNLAGNPIDVDFAAFGPFESLGEACYLIGNPPATTYIVDCSYSAAATETINLDGQAGDVFAILVTNFNGSQGNATITQTSGPDVSCVPTVDLGQNLVLCDTASHNLTATVNNPGDAQVYTYTWYMDGSTTPFTPTVVATTNTSQTISVTEPGSHTYHVVVTMPIPVNSDPVEDTVTIALSHPFTVPTPDPITVCGSGGTAQIDLSAINFLGTLDPDDYTVVGVYLSQANANSGQNPIDISVPFTATTQTLYIVVADVLVPTCKKVVPLSITVNNGFSATLSYPEDVYCTTTVGPVNTELVQVGGEAGTYTVAPATGLTIDLATGAIDPSTSTAGTYDVTYTIPASDTCEAFAVTTTVEIITAASATVTYDASAYCNSGTTTPVVVGTQGGTFAGGTGLVIDPVTGEIDLAASTPGSYEITYTIAANGPCSAVVVPVTVEINESFSATISYPDSPYCSTETVGVPTHTGSINGTYEVFPASTAGLSIDPQTGEIDITASEPGTYEVVYHIPSNGSCAEFFSAPATVVIQQAPDADTTIQYGDGIAPYCSDSGLIPVVINITNPAGQFTAAPAGLDINLTTGDITTSTSTPGTYTVTFTIPATATCDELVRTTTVTINERPTAEVTYTAAEYCSDGGITIPTLTATNNAGGTFSATPAGLSINGTTGAIDLGLSTPDTYEVIYTIPAANGCDEVISIPFEVTVTKLPSAGFGYEFVEVCTNVSTVAPVFTTGSIAGTFTVDHTGLAINAITGVITPADSEPGIYIITNTIEAAAGCGEVTESVTITINPAPVADFTYDAPAYCQANDDVPTPALDGDSGIFSATPAGLVIDAATGIIDVQESTPGTYQVINTIVGSADCPTVVSTAVTVVITARPVINVTQGCDGIKYQTVVNFEEDAIYNEDNVDFAWYAGSVSGDPIGTEASQQITEGGTYYVVVTPQTGALCPLTQEVVVANTICEVPKGISPDGTIGDNDTFDLTGYGVQKLVIFNRYGKEVFSFNGAYTNQWHGQAGNGEDLPTGTYFYMIHRNTGESKTGWVYINRAVK